MAVHLVLFSYLPVFSSRLYVFLKEGFNGKNLGSLSVTPSLLSFAGLFLPTGVF